MKYLWFNLGVEIKAIGERLDRVPVLRIFSGTVIRLGIRTRNRAMSREL